MATTTAPTNILQQLQNQVGQRLLHRQQQISFNNYKTKLANDYYIANNKYPSTTTKPSWPTTTTSPTTNILQQLQNQVGQRLLHHQQQISFNNYKTKLANDFYIANNEFSNKFFNQVITSTSTNTNTC